MSQPQSAPIKPSGRGEIGAAQFKLLAWLLRQTDRNVLGYGFMVVDGLAAARIGSAPHPAIIDQLATDVEKLRLAHAHLTSSTPGH